MSRHMTLAFRALWKWPDGATFEGKIYSLSRGLDAGPKAVVGVGLVTFAFRADERGSLQAPAAGTEIGQLTQQESSCSSQGLESFIL
jgi:hypothetical protein